MKLKKFDHCRESPLKANGQQQWRNGDGPTPTLRRCGASLASRSAGPAGDHRSTKGAPTSARGRAEQRTNGKPQRQLTNTKPHPPPSGVGRRWALRHWAGSSSPRPQAKGQQHQQQQPAAQVRSGTLIQAEARGSAHGGAHLETAWANARADQQNTSKPGQNPRFKRNTPRNVFGDTSSSGDRQPRKKRVGQGEQPARAAAGSPAWIRASRA